MPTATWQTPDDWATTTPVSADRLQRIANDLMALPRGVLKRALASANQGSIVGTEVAITSLSCAVTLEAGRRVRARAHLFVSDTVANEHCAILIRTAAGVQGRSEFDTSVIAGNGLAMIAETPPLDLAAGSYTFTVGLQRTTGTGTLTANGGVAPSWLTVEDVGPAI